MKNVKLKRVVSVLLLCAMTVTRLIGGEAELINATGELQEYIITTEDVSTLNKIKKHYKENIVDDYKAYNVDNKVSVYAGLTENQRKSIENSDGVINVEENTVFSACESHKKHVVKRKKAKKSDALDWNMRMIGATSADLQNPGEDGAVKIAIMDSGIDVSEDVNVVERVNLVDDEKNIAPYYEDITGHGTSIAGIVSDIDPDAELYSVRILDSNNTARLDRVIEGIYWCIDHDINIINMSFGTKYRSTALEKAVNAAYDAGILLISATGNGGNEECVEYPAAYEKVIAVGGVDKNAVLTDESATGEEVELVAPGSQILTDGAFGGSLVAGGTSLSVAHVTGAASAIWEKDLSKTNRFVRDLLSDSAKRIGDRKSYGNGLVDIKYALEYYDEYANSYSQIDCETGESVIEVYPENDTDVKTFDDVQLVEGRWNDKGHKDLVDIGNSYQGMQAGLSADELWIIKDACAKVDGIFDHGVNQDASAYHFRTSTENVLHGKYNYISTMRYLFRVCRRIYDSSEGTTISACCNAFSYSPHSDNADYDRSIPGNLKNAIQYMAAADTPIINPSGISWQKKRGLRILGMMMHVVGDTYAHKSKVPLKTLRENVFSGEIKAGYTRDEFRTTVQKGMMFNQVNKYFINGVYEDNTGICPDRYEAAKAVSNNVLRHFAAKLDDIAIDGAMKEARQYDDNGILCEDTQLAYLSKHVRWEFNDKKRAVVAGTVSFIPYTGEYISIK